MKLMGKYQKNIYQIITDEKKNQTLKPVPMTH